MITATGQIGTAWKAYGWPAARRVPHLLIVAGGLPGSGPVAEQDIA
jgi:hypothetical protein